MNDKPVHYAIKIAPNSLLKNDQHARRTSPTKKSSRVVYLLLKSKSRECMFVTCMAADSITK